MMSYYMVMGVVRGVVTSAFFEVRSSFVRGMTSDVALRGVFVFPAYHLLCVLYES